MLIVLVGARGAGKTTLLDTLKSEGVTVLQPSTTRSPRFEGESEYDFVQQWDVGAHAWRIDIGTHTYGMRKSEIEKARRQICVTVFDPQSIHVFEEARRGMSIDTLTIGLNTISDIAEQHRRVGCDPNRMMEADELSRVTTTVSECDVVLRGEAQTIRRALLSILALLNGRGGVVTRNHLVPLMNAGALLNETDKEHIRPASYDLRSVGTSFVGAKLSNCRKTIQGSRSRPTRMRSLGPKSRRIFHRF